MLNRVEYARTHSRGAGLYGDRVATTLLTNATLWTGTDRPPYWGWLLVAGEHIGAVGALDSPVPPADRVLDLAGTHILPGFVDSHLHLTVSAWLPYGIDGWHWSDLGTALAAIRDAAARDPYAPWLMFWNARPFAWRQRRLPSAAELDALAPGRPILVSGLDVHRGTATGAVGPPARCGSSPTVRRCAGRCPTPSSTSALTVSKGSSGTHWTGASRWESPMSTRPV